jgi:hypothetical protein
MTKLLDIDALIEKDGWVGLFSRLALASIGYAVIYWAPQICIWCSSTFFSQHLIIDEKRHRTIVYFATALFGYFIIISAMLAFKIVQSKNRGVTKAR